MTEWTKIKKARPGRPQASGPRVRRQKGRTHAHLILPISMKKAPRCDVLSDGNGQLAFHQHENGSFAVAGRLRFEAQITIPVDFVDRIPIGTTEVQLTKDGDMLVLDLNAIGGAA